jgi:hypothetical protein
METGAMLEIALASVVVVLVGAYLDRHPAA